MISRMQDFLENEWYYYKKRLTNRYYIIRRSANGAGFFSNYMWVLGHVIFARKLGYIPVVDMENYPTLYSEEEPVCGERNAWNYYFENVGKATLEEVYASGKYVMGQDMPLHKYEEKYCLGGYRFPSQKTIAYYAPVIKKNLVIRKELTELFREEWKHRVSLGEEVLGIHVRGTDMKNRLGHPVPAAVQTYLEKARTILLQHPEIKKVFLATDECDVKESFEQAFKDSRWELFMNDTFRIWDIGLDKRIGIHETKVANPRPLHKYLLGREVLQDAWFLSKCDYLLCGQSNISNVAILWNNNQYKQVICISEHVEICKQGEDTMI